MPYEIGVSDEFKVWYEDTLSEAEQLSVERVVEMLAEAGPMLGFPYSSGIQQSRYSHMRELRIQHEGRPYRVLYAFDRRRMALLLIGGDKSGDERWYEKAIPQADAIYGEHVKELNKKHAGPPRYAEEIKMAHTWNSLKHKASPAKRAAVKKEALAELERIGFGKLRQARHQTQVAVAEKLGIPQGSVSRLERQQDMLLSTLGEYVAALGGKLEMRVVFPEASFELEPLSGKRPA